MKFTLAFIATVILATSVSSAPVRRDVDPALIPDLGATAGLNPTGESRLLRWQRPKLKLSI